MVADFRFGGQPLFLPGSITLAKVTRRIWVAPRLISSLTEQYGSVGDVFYRRVRPIKKIQGVEVDLSTSSVKTSKQLQ